MGKVLTNRDGRDGVECRSLPVAGVALAVIVRGGVDPAAVGGFHDGVVGPADPRCRARAADDVLQQRIDQVATGRTAGEDRPATLVEWLLGVASLQDGAPVHHLVVDIQADLAKGIDRDLGKRVVDQLIRRMQEGDRLAAVLRLVQHGLNLIDAVRLGHRVHAGIVGRRRARDEVADRHAPKGRVFAHGRDHLVLLVDRRDHGAPHAGIGRRALEVIEPQMSVGTEDVEQPGGHAVLLRQHRHQVGLGNLDPVHLAGHRVEHGAR